ncbi:MAG: DinB family protein [Anaerolineaceae bacterium]|nr:DinB family protein [Anaerolineaceae bacterium]
MENILNWATAVLTTMPSRWESMTHTWPVELLRRPPAAGEWSALECLQHILDTEPIFSARMKYFLEGQDFPAFDPDKEGTPLNAAASPQEMSAAFARLRPRSLAALAAIRPDDLGRRARHAELGMVTMGEMIHEWAAHDLNHTVQAERAAMQPFIQGCGAWQVYFQDHLVKGR